MIFFIYIYIEKKNKHWWIRKPENKKEVTLKQKKRQDVSQNIPSCHFLLIVIATESYLKIQKSRMFLRIGFVKLSIFHY